jgi:hypothetical protein
LIKDRIHWIIIFHFYHLVVVIAQFNLIRATIGIFVYDYLFHFYILSLALLCFRHLQMIFYNSFFLNIIVLEVFFILIRLYIVCTHSILLYFIFLNVLIGFRLYKSSRYFTFLWILIEIWLSSFLGALYVFNNAIFF